MRNLTPEEVNQIPVMVEAGMRMPDIAAKLGCSKASIQSWIVKYRKVMKDQGVENPLPILKGRPPMKLKL
jgi:uncharacterized protein YjcR